MAGLGGAIARWEKFRFNPPPSLQQEMLPPPGVGMKMEPIRLCGACYAELPCHKIEWQFKGMQGCDRPGLRLLSECPNGGARFKIPALWVNGWCQGCFLTFSKMTNSQKSL